MIAKADSMTVDELRQFRKYIRSELEQVLDMHCAFPVPRMSTHATACPRRLADLA